MIRRFIKESFQKIEKGRFGQKEKLTHMAIDTEVSDNPVTSSGTEMTFLSCYNSQ